jgi:phosphinothricin acetyltransferase
MLIRPASLADLPQIQAMWNDMIRDTNATFTSIEKTAAMLGELLLDRKEQFLVAEAEGSVAGFVTWGSFRVGDGYVHTAEHSIITTKSGQGVGRALMEAAIASARSQGICTMIAGIGHENTDAVAFHSRLGFALTGRLPQVGYKNGLWHDLILMSRSLTTP